jgi:hypothetical protein
MLQKRGLEPTDRGVSQVQPGVYLKLLGFPWKLRKRQYLFPFTTKTSNQSLKTHEFFYQQLSTLVHKLLCIAPRLIEITIESNS